MIQPIRLFGDPVLRTPAEPVVDFDKELRRLVADLTETMLDAPGAGLAAPQIGVGLRVFTYHVDDELGHLVNPASTSSRGGAGRRRGLPVVPRARLPDCKRALRRRRQGLQHARRAGARSRAPSCWPARSSTRPTTSTASCSSTGWTRTRARRR